MNTTLFNKPLKENKKYRKIYNVFYEENKSVFLIDGKWRRIIAPGIYIDKYNKVSKIKEGVDLIDCLIGKDKDNNLIFAKMDRDCYNKIYVLIDNNGSLQYYIAWPDLCLENLNLKFDNKYNFYYESHIYETFKKETIERIKNSFKYESPYVYNSYELIERYSSTKKNIVNEDLDPVFDSDIVEYLKDVTFGIEFETCDIKFVPNDILLKYGLIPLRDGSINGYEFATIPLKGYDGLKSLFYICGALNKYCNFDKSCSTHIHMSIDNMPKKDIRFIERLLNVGFQVQNEIYKIVPDYKYFDINHEKNKFYTKPIPYLDFSIEYAIEYEDEETKEIELESNSVEKTSVSEFLTGVNNNKTLLKGIHPSNPDNQHKWNIKERYYWLNTIPYFFNNGSIENRMMEATFDFNKILSWIILTASIIKFSIDEKNKDKVVDMNDVAQYSNNKTIVDCITKLLNK